MHIVELMNLYYSLKHVNAEVKLFKVHFQYRIKEYLMHILQCENE